MAEVLQVDDEIEEILVEQMFHNYDFRSWSPADVMSFIERSLPGPAHQTTIDIIRTLGLDGDLLAELNNNEPEFMLPISPEVNAVLKSIAHRMVRNFNSNEHVQQARHRRGWRFKIKLEQLMNRVIRERSRGGEMGGAMFVGRDDDEVEVVMDDIVRLRRCLEIDPDKLGRLLLRDVEDENRELVRFAARWVEAAITEYGRRQRGLRHRRIEVPFRQDDPPRLEQDLEQEDAGDDVIVIEPMEEAEHHAEPQPELLEPQGQVEEPQQEVIVVEPMEEAGPQGEPQPELLEPQDPVEEPRPQTPREPEPEGEEMEQDPVEPVIAEQRVEQPDMRFLAERMPEHQVIFEQQQVLGERIREMEGTLARGEAGINAHAIRGQILVLMEERLQLMRQGRDMVEQNLMAMLQMQEDGRAVELRPVIRAPPEHVEQFADARERMTAQARERARAGRQNREAAPNTQPDQQEAQ